MTPGRIKRAFSMLATGKDPAAKRRVVPASRRGYAAAKMDRLTSSWKTASLSADGEIRTALKVVRARARDLVYNTDHGRKFMNMVGHNVVGPKGIALQMKVGGSRPDDAANRIIEGRWREWGRKGVCDVTGLLSWVDIQRLVIKSVVRDGEVLVMLHKGNRVNKHGFALQMIEADHLDELYSEASRPDRGRIVMGVEVSSTGKPVAYHIYTNHPGDLFGGYLNRQARERVPAEMLMHIYQVERVGQTRGISWMHTAMSRLNMLSAYEEAELVAARGAASKMGFFETPTGDDYTGDDTENGDVITEFEPGIFEQLPAGWEFKPFDPDHPSTTFDTFSKSILRSIAAGLDVSYTSLANDLEGVNYSSIRSGKLEEWDAWRTIQGWEVDHFCRPIFEQWLGMGLLTGSIPFPAEKFDRFNAPSWIPRGWEWVDPQKEQTANVTAVNLGVKSRREIAASQGKDLEETMREIAEEEALMKELGIYREPKVSGKQLPQKEDKDDAEDD